LRINRRRRDKKNFLAKTEREEKSGNLLGETRKGDFTSKSYGSAEKPKSAIRKVGREVGSSECALLIPPEGRSDSQKKKGGRE